MILLYPKKRKNKDTFFIFPRAAGREGAAGAAGGRGSALPNRREKETSGGETVLSRRGHRAKARPRSPETTGSHCASRGTQVLSRRRRPRTAYFAAASPQRGRPNSSEAGTKRNLRGGTVLSRRRHRAKARLAPPKRRVHIAPRGAHRLFRAAGGRGRLISRRHRSAGGSAKWSVTAAPSMRR